jgi:hypothetical protein
MGADQELSHPAPQSGISLSAKGKRGLIRIGSPLSSLGERGQGVRGFKRTALVDN